jgi:hypothetical protein
LTMNHWLERTATAAGIGWLDITDAFADADGFLDPAKSDGLVHVDYRCVAPIEGKLAALFGPAPPAGGTP